MNLLKDELKFKSQERKEGWRERRKETRDVRETQEVDKKWKEEKLKLLREKFHAATKQYATNK